MADPVRVPYLDHPDRCQSLSNEQGNRGGQCEFLSESGSKYCFIHGGHKAVIADTVKSLNVYRIGKYEKRLKEFTTANGARGIDEELAIMRMLLEETINRCTDQMELLLYSSKISDLINDIKSLVLSADKLATKRGMLIGRAEGLVIAGQVVEIISKYVNDEQALGKIADEVAIAFLTEINDAPDTRTYR